MDRMLAENIERGALRFIRNSSKYGKMSIAVRRVNEKPEIVGLRFIFYSGGWIRTNDPRVVSLFT
jgi:hypothetical protein